MKYKMPIGYPIEKVYIPEGIIPLNIPSAFCGILDYVSEETRALIKEVLWDPESETVWLKTAMPRTISYLPSNTHTKYLNFEAMGTLEVLAGHLLGAFMVQKISSNKTDQINQHRAALNIHFQSRFQEFLKETQINERDSIIVQIQAANCRIMGDIGLLNARWAARKESEEAISARGVFRAGFHL